MAITRPARVGLIADTHDLVRPEALAYLQGCDAIVHAGDICAPAVLDALSAIAPVTAVRGNNDTGAWANALPATTTLTVRQVTIFVVHDIADLPDAAARGGASVIVFGHSHKPLVDRRDGVLFVNPGSAGPRRFVLPVSAGMLTIDGDKAEASLQKLITT